MAEVTRSSFGEPQSSNRGMGVPEKNRGESLPGGGAPVIYYKMRGMDNGTPGLYDTWIVTNSADFSATLYAGALATPLLDVVIASSWSI